MTLSKDKAFNKMWKEARGEEDVVVLHGLPERMKRVAWFDYEIKFTEEELREKILGAITG